MEEVKEEEELKSQTSSESLAISIVSRSTSTRVNPQEHDFNRGFNVQSDTKTAVEEEDDGTSDYQRTKIERLEEFNPELWLPITESRKGNLWFCIFHLVSSGIGGIQSLALPFAFVSLGWAWGITWLSIAFIWQLYTMWLLVQLHQSNSGHRCSRYLQLAISAFGPKLGKLLCMPPLMFLSGGTCVLFLIIGGSTMQNLHQLLCENDLNCSSKVTTTEWYLVFICLAIAMAQLPNLNSVAWVSLVSALTGLVYTTLLWVIPLREGRPSEYSSGFSRVDVDSETRISQVMAVFTALGIISFSYRGHNLVLEIQGTLPTKKKNPTTHKTMWRAVMLSYAITGLCLFSIAIAGFQTYGTLTPKAGLLRAFRQFYGNPGSKLTLAVIYMFIIVNILCTFQIYAMLVFDNFELRYMYMSKAKKPCRWWIRTALRLFFGGLAIFISVAVPFLPVIAPLTGAIGLPVTFAYPCFMWVLIKKPKLFGSMWWINVVLGCLGVVLSVMLVVSALYNLVTQGVPSNFFHPKPVG